MSVDIGSRIKEIRKSQRITLKALSQATNLSESYLSQVERGICAASVSSLEKIAEVLKTNMEVLVLEDDDSPATIQNYSYISPPGESYYYKMLSDNTDGKRIQCRQITLLPGHSECLFPLRESGFIYVLSGCLNTRLGDEENLLFPGDSIYHDETMQLACWNDSKYLTTCLYVTYLETEAVE